MILLKLTDASLAFGTIPLLGEVSWQIDRSERVCIIGCNDTDKSNLFKAIKGEQQADDGEIWYAPVLKIDELPQELPRAGEQTVFGVVAKDLAEAGELFTKYHHLSLNIHTNDDLVRLPWVQQELEARNGWRLQ